MKLFLIILVSLLVLGMGLALATTNERRQGGGGEDDDKQQDENPYVFGEMNFNTTTISDHGSINVLQKFTDKSELLRGVENYRVAFLRANPSTFFIPSHWNADTVLYVANGRPSLTIIFEDRRERFNLEHGDIMRVPSGRHVYIINKDCNQKLYIIALLRSVNVPGDYEDFVAPSLQVRDSFYQAFSWELLEAAFQIDRSIIGQIFRQKQPSVVKASNKQILALTQGGQQGGGVRPLGSQSSGPFNLLQCLVCFNNYGQLFEARPNEHKEQLQDLDLMISFANITRGSMMGPYYNSRATKISVVVDGEGYLEMACPTFSSGSRPFGSMSQTYRRISSRLRPGMVFVVPVGHPVSIVASPNCSCLSIICFEVNAQGNIRSPLAGKNNILRQWDMEAKELAFGVNARVMDRVFGSQNEEWFYPGPIMS